MDITVQQYLKIRNGIINVNPSSEERNALNHETTTIFPQIIWWVNTFNCKVPKGWQSPDEVIGHLKNAHNAQENMSETHLDACVSHPEKEVVFSAAKYQNLSIKQLSIVLLSPFLSEEIKTYVVQNQRERGLSHQDIEAALDLANKIPRPKDQKSYLEVLKEVFKTQKDM